MDLLMAYHKAPDKNVLIYALMLNLIAELVKENRLTWKRFFK